MSIVRLVVLHLSVLVWRYRYAMARRFRLDLEETIARERVRAIRDVEETEIALRRAEMAIVAFRADQTIREGAC